MHGAFAFTQTSAFINSRAPSSNSTSRFKSSEAERTQEVARMLSGARLTETSLKHAEQLLKTNA